MAKQVGEDNNPCPSRHIGIVIVHPEQNRVLGTGYNGPPRGTPHTDSPEYLNDVVWPQLSPNDKAVLAAADPDFAACPTIDQFLTLYSNSGKCPRKLLKIVSGERMGLCSCEHGEKNSIANASQNIHGAWMICWCGVPCWDCSKLIINSGIIKVVCVDDGKPDYSTYSRWLLSRGHVEIEMRDINTLDYLETVKPVAKK